MRPLSNREHARLARQLIEACGGLEEAASACRVGKSALSSYQSPHEDQFMPADVLDALEVYAGRGPIYSGAISDRRVVVAGASNIGEAACNLSEMVLEAQAVVRRSIADGRVSPRELDAIHAAEADCERALDQLKAARRAIEAATPSTGPTFAACSSAKMPLYQIGL